VTRDVTTGEEDALRSYHAAHARYESMRLLLRYEDRNLMDPLRLAGKRVLELGCGSLPLVLAADGARFRYVGTDLSGVGLRLAKELAPRSGFLVCDAMTPGLAPRSFDVVMMKNLLHHLERPEKCLAAVRELLAPGGTVVVLEPNSTCLAGSIARGLLRLLDRELEESPYGQLTVRELRNVFRVAGFEEREVRHTGLLAYPVSGDFGAMKLIPMALPIWKLLIGTDRLLSRLLMGPRWLSSLLGFKVIFHLVPRTEGQGHGAAACPS
jgi:2-polyprenyl-3-methyl-5-hydroxy-6-metoxy-1,4-benzoquinol methylase